MFSFFPLTGFFFFKYENRGKSQVQCIFWWGSAAEASLEIIGKENLNGTSTYHVRFSARSKGIINYLFPINDKIDLWLTEDSLLTVKESLRIREGNYKKSQEMILNHSKILWF